MSGNGNKGALSELLAIAAEDFSGCLMIQFTNLIQELHVTEKVYS